MNTHEVYTKVMFQKDSPCALEAEWLCRVARAVRADAITQRIILAGVATSAQTTTAAVDTRQNMRGSKL